MARFASKGRAATIDAVARAEGAGAAETPRTSAHGRHGGFLGGGSADRVKLSRFSKENGTLRRRSGQAEPALSRARAKSLDLGRRCASSDSGVTKPATMSTSSMRSLSSCLRSEVNSKRAQAGAEP